MGYEDECFMAGVCDVAERLIAEHPEVWLVKNPVNMGKGAAIPGVSGAGRYRSVISRLKWRRGK